MSRSKLIRALLAAASLLAAVPLMAQSQATTVAAAPAFPMGRYTVEAVDSSHAPPPGFVVEFVGATLKVYNGQQLLETHGMTIEGTKWEIFELDGNCVEPGDYTWHQDGALLWMTLVSDPCADRAASITAVRFRRE